MGIVIGIDVGISTTKIVGIRNNRIIRPIRINATDPVTSLYGAFGKYLNDNNLELSDVEHVMLTGVGSAYIKGSVYGLPTSKTDEFIADGLGAQYESNLNRMIVVSMGTGTTLVKYDKGDISHIGGIGMGGGTLAGLSRLLLGTDDIKHVSKLAESGNILVYGAEKEYTSLSTEAAKVATKRGGITIGVAGGKSKKVFVEDRRGSTGRSN